MHLIMTVNRHVKAGGGGVRGAISFSGESFLNNLISAMDLSSYDG